MREVDIKHKYNIKYFDELPSTHLFAKERYQKLHENTVIIAEKQLSGIGTHGRSWYSGNGNNIAMSILYKPKCHIENFDCCTMKIANKIQECIKELYNIQLKIKYPNDLQLNNKKICGILTEVGTIAGKINYLIVSLGFNVNEVDFNPELYKIATSLKKEFKRDFDKQEIIYNFLNVIDEIIDNCIKK